MNREKKIMIRVNGMEEEQIKNQAAKRGKTVSEYLRWLVDHDAAKTSSSAGAVPPPDTGED